MSPESLRFTADNWSVAQEVTVRAAEDADAEVDAEVTVRHAVSGYGAVTTAADVAVTRFRRTTDGGSGGDADGPSCPLGTVLEEPQEVAAGATRWCWNRLRRSQFVARWSGDGRGGSYGHPAWVAVTPLDGSPESLSFTADNWSEPQEVTLRAAEDADAEVDAEVTVRHAGQAVTAASAVAR